MSKEIAMQNTGAAGSFRQENFRRRSRYITVFAVLAAAFCVIIVININSGNVHIPIGRILDILFTTAGDPKEVDIIWTIRLPRILMAAMLGGALAAWIAAVPRALWNVSETILTMMLNYVFLNVLNYLMYGPWKELNQMVAQTREIDSSLWLPEFGNTGISLALLIAVAIAFLLWFLLKKTTWGYQMEVIRRSPRAAEYAGMSVKKNIISTLCLSGAIAGLAGFAEVNGVLHRVQADLPNNAGYTGIVIAFLAYLNPLSTVLVAFLLGALQISAVAVQITGVPSQVATMIQGSIMLFVIAGEFFIRYRLVKVQKGEAA